MNRIIAIRSILFSLVMLAACAGGAATDSANPIVPRIPVTSVEVQPSITPVLAPGGRLQFTATLRDAKGQLLVNRSVTWTSSTANVASVDANGQVTAIADGQTTIAAASEGESGSVILTVRTPVARVEPSVDTVTLTPGGARTVTATVRGPSGGALANRAIVWASTNPVVATVSPTGTITAVAPGQATITATAEGTTGQIAVRVQNAAIRSLTLSPTNLQQVAGQSTTLVPRVQRADSAVAVIFSYVSSNSSVVTVTSAGVLTAQAQGLATITVTAIGSGPNVISNTLTAQVAVTVSAPQPGITSLSVSPASIALEATEAQQLNVTASGPGADSATFIFATSAPSVVVVSTGGRSATLTGVSPGTAIITVTAQTKPGIGYLAASTTAQVPVTVRPAATASLVSITRGSSDIPSDIASLSGEHRVILNLVSNGNTVRSIRLFVCAAGAQCPANAAVEQTFGATGTSTGQISLTLNTAEFSVAADWSNATVRYPNGDKRLVAQIVTGTTASATLASVTFNNTDNIAVRHLVPTRSWIGPDNTVRYGGLGSDGMGSLTVVPVVYTPGRTIQQLSVAVTGSACSNAPYTFSVGTDARPWTLTYGAFTTATAPVSSRNRRCTGVSTGVDLTASVASVFDNVGARVLLPASFATSPGATPPVGLPAVIRADYSPNVSP